MQGGKYSNEFRAQSTGAKLRESFYGVVRYWFRHVCSAVLVTAVYGCARSTCWKIIGSLVSGQPPLPIACKQSKQKRSTIYKRKYTTSETASSELQARSLSCPQLSPLISHTHTRTHARTHSLARGRTQRERKRERECVCVVYTKRAQYTRIYKPSRAVTICIVNRKSTSPHASLHCS